MDKIKKVLSKIKNACSKGINLCSEKVKFITSKVASTCKKGVQWYLGLPQKTQIISAVVAGTVVIGSGTGIAIATAHRHEYVSAVTAATCEEQGYTTYTCECGDSYVDDYVSALGHAEVVDLPVSATCTENGLLEGTHCSTCNKILRPQEVIPATGHTEGDWITDADATCTIDGSKHRICSVCEDTIATEAIPATGHTDGEWITDTEPTCIEEGSKHQICSVCEETIHNESIAATGIHDYVGEITIQATCTEDGVKVFTCSHCNNTYEEPVKAKGQHTYRTLSSNQATCTEEGTTTYICSLCDHQYTKTTSSALGHSWKSATCTSPKTCSRCNTTSGSADTTKHSWKAATCIAPKTCSICKATEGGKDTSKHSYSLNGSCTICGSSHPYHYKMKNYITSYGSYSSKTGDYSVCYYSTSDTAHFAAYDLSEGTISISTMVIYKSETYLMTIEFNANFYGTYNWTLSDTSGRIMYGTFNSTTFGSSATLSYSNTNVTYSLRSAYADLASSLARTTITSVNYKLKPKCGVSAYQMGFYMY